MYSKKTFGWTAWLASALVAGSAAAAQTAQPAPAAFGAQTMLTATVPATTDIAGLAAQASPFAMSADGPVSSSREAALPEDPGAWAQNTTLQGSTAPAGAVAQQPHVAPIHTEYIPSGWTALPLKPKDKIIIGMQDLYSPLSILAILSSAGYEQLTNGSPNYGTDRGAFGERLGAAGIRESSQTIFTEMVFAPLYHEDERYYIKGHGTGFVHRAAYAATRVLVTRSDSGHATINGALLSGYAATAAMSNYTYYPEINHNFKDTASSFGGSLGGAAIGYLVSEFSGDVIQALHFHKK